MNATIFKAYNTQSAADKYVARNFANRNDIAVEFVGGLWLVVGA